MPTAVVYHDMPIASAVRDRLPELHVVEAIDETAVFDTLPRGELFVTNPTKWVDGFLDCLDEGDWVQATSVGYAAFPIDEFERRGIQFTNASGLHTTAVSEHALALALVISRKLDRTIRQQDQRTWDRSVGAEMGDWSGNRMTVYGLGNIGEAVARRGRAFGLDVYGVKRRPSTYTGVLEPDTVVHPRNAHALFEDTDLLVLTVPLTESTRHAIDEDEFAVLPDSAVIVNVARGAVVNQDALVTALERGNIGGAGLDVFRTEPLPEKSPLWDRDDVVITPHVGGRSRDLPDRFGGLFAENYRHWRADEGLVNRIV